MTAVLETHGLSAGYVPEVDILHDVDLHVAPGEMVTIVGPNGAGKSTFLKVVMGLLPARAGVVRLWGEDGSGLTPHTIARRGVGYVPQRANVFCGMTVDENLELGLVGRKARAFATLRDGVCELFPLLGERRRQLAGTLSGGERQQLAMGRVLMAEPTLVLLDEPSAALSPSMVDVIFEKIAEIHATGISVLMVEQNARRALAMSSRGYVLDLGENRFEGRGPELLADPKIAAVYLGGMVGESA